MNANGIQSLTDCYTGGYRIYNGGAFNNLGNQGDWWSSTPYSTNAWKRELYYSYATVNRNNNNRSFGFSVRCVRN